MLKFFRGCQWPKAFGPRLLMSAYTFIGPISTEIVPPLHMLWMYVLACLQQGIMCINTDWNSDRGGNGFGGNSFFS